MVQKVKNTLDLVKNMGLHYLAFRVKHELLRRSGLLKKKFPSNPSYLKMPLLEEWRSACIPFFFQGKKNLSLPKNSTQILEEKHLNISNGTFLFFSSLPVQLKSDYNWTTNPDTGYVYDPQKHWTEIADYSEEAGDIKYVWEKSRFCFLYDIIRYDYHFDADCSEGVFKEILSWTEHNHINCGPNYRCSQEISLRVLNWIFALYYYKDSPALTEDIFHRILHAMYWQMRHVYSNIQFSLIAVRNNHAITETLGLYLFGLLFPFFPESKKWKNEGKKWFEQEIEYQIYPDGTFLQFSMNYHRVVVQLLTWAIRLSALNQESLSQVVIDRARASLHFLYNCMNLQDGFLPNYGANDGALFFPLNDCDFRDYRPQLQALSAVLGEKKIGEGTEDVWWYGLTEQGGFTDEQVKVASFPDGGYYLLREEDTFTFIRCGRHKDRPSQADNLHLDLWVNGKNFLRDGGSYKYNTDETSLRYFFGTASHNTIMLGDLDQMKKGGRFIWYYWSQALQAGWKEYDEYYEFIGAINAFRQIHSEIVHTRTVRKYKKCWKWEVIDEVEHCTSLSIHQLWHSAEYPGFSVIFSSFDADGNVLMAKKKAGWYSPKYGIKEEADTAILSTQSQRIKTFIEIKTKE
jgi:hypothetical protein